MEHQVRVKRYLCPERIPAYQQGGEGFIRFVEENVRFAVPQVGTVIPKWTLVKNLPDDINEETGKSFKEFWNKEKEELKRALELKSNGDFKHRLIVLCWMRGEGKSFLVCLIQIWKFFCFPRQLIVLGANSKDQVKFVHYDIIKGLIENSPNLIRVVGKRNIQEKMIMIKNKKNEILSSIRSISTATGIVSNITGYTFSEMFDMKDPRFFVQLDGSVRNIPGALGTIDSTVSDKKHILYGLYKSFINGTDKTLYFSYRGSPDADYRDYWHPLMNESQLNAYEARFPPADFDRYFKNVWELASGRMFSEVMINQMFQIGADGKIGNQDLVKDLLTQKYKLEVESKAISRLHNRNVKKQSKKIRQRQQSYRNKQIASINDRLTPIDSLYRMHEGGLPCSANSQALDILGKIYDTEWALLAGLDRSDPGADDPQARTIVSGIAKGLPGSLSKRMLPTDFEDSTTIPYIYFLIHLDYVEDASLEGIKTSLGIIYNSFGGIDTLCSERWGAWDLAPWCDEREIKFETVFPSYERQKKAFNSLFMSMSNGTFKSPIIHVPGSESNNILWEEATMFDYHPITKWYGSPEKNKKGGIQDDVIFSIGWCIYGGRELDVDDFKNRSAFNSMGFGEMYQNTNNLQPPQNTFIGSKVSYD